MTTNVMRLVCGAGLLALLGAGMQAATEDVSLPANYRQTLRNFTVVDRADTGQVRVLFGSAAALDAVKAGRPAPSGSVMVMEIFAAQRDAQNQLLRGADGRLQRGALANIFVMEKRTGWGAAYAEGQRNGDWEYATFTAAGQRGENRDTTACRTCHLPKAANDFLQLPAEFLPGV
jgi:Cytochrome P460